MKITALIPDSLVQDVRHFACGKTLTDSLICALDEWVRLKKLKSLNQDLVHNPLKFAAGVTADKIRAINRQ